jgi:hypothetical protein
MTPKQFQKLLDRDVCCLHCGETEAISPNHRVNRGMGGSKILDRPANLIVLCSEMNSLIESNWFHRELAIQYGWKLERWQSPEDCPVFDSRLWQWFKLDNDYNRVPVETPKELEQAKRKTALD